MSNRAVRYHRSAMSMSEPESEWCVVLCGHLAGRCVNGQTLLHTAAALNDVKSCKVSAAIVAKAVRRCEVILYCVRITSHCV